MSQKKRLNSSANTLGRETSTNGLGKELTRISDNRADLAVEVLNLLKNGKIPGLINTPDQLVETARATLDSFQPIQLQTLAKRNGGEKLLNELHSILVCSTDANSAKPRCEKIEHALKATGKGAPTGSKYAKDWYPPKPHFGSPTSDLPALMNRLGNPKYKVLHPGENHSPISFTDGWANRNVSNVYIPQLKGLPEKIENGKFVGNICQGNVQFYTKAHSALKELFGAWEKAGLISKILTCGGSFNARTIRRTLTPSNHTFGLGFDINSQWNKEKHPPAAIGEEGCLLELVPAANAHGFYWGGFYSASALDGMHFECSKF